MTDERRSRSFRVLASAALVALAAVAALGAAPLGDGALRPLFTLDTTVGLGLYEASCAGCHGFGGEGLRSAVPPLAGTVPLLLAGEGGREYVVAVLLHGLSGRIEVSGESYDGLMPSWAHLADEQVAAVLNHVATAWGNVGLLPPAAVEFTALEVALARARPTDHASLTSARRSLAQSSAQ